MPRTVAWIRREQRRDIVSTGGRGQWAVLQFQSRGITAPRNVIQVNGVDVAGGLSIDPVVGLFGGSGDTDLPTWTAHSLLVPPNTLEEDNVLRIESRVENFPDTGRQRDDFLIDNVVIFFKTRGVGAE